MSKQATSYMSDGHGSDDGSCASSIKESTSFDGVCMYKVDKNAQANSKTAATSSLKSLYGQIHHLVENEASFVRSLKHINDRIAEPVWKRYLPWNLSTQTDPALRARPSSQRQLISSLFYTTPALMRTHDNFLTDLKSLDMKALSIRQVVWIFYMNIPELQGHVELMDKHISALATFEMLRYTDATFLPTFQERMGDIVLPEFFIKPRERIWHYISFLENLMNRCVMLSNDRDLHAINSCLEQLQELDQAMTPLFDKLQEIQRLAIIQASIVGLPRAFLSRDQELAAEGEFACTAVGNRQAAAAAIQFSASHYDNANISGQLDNHTLTTAWLLGDRIVLASKLGVDQFTYMTTIHLKEATVCVRMAGDAKKPVSSSSSPSSSIRNKPAMANCNVIYMFDRRGGVMLYPKNANVFASWRKALRSTFSRQIGRDHAYVEVDQLPEISHQ